MIEVLYIGQNPATFVTTNIIGSACKKTLMANGIRLWEYGPGFTAENSSPEFFLSNYDGISLICSAIGRKPDIIIYDRLWSLWSHNPDKHKLFMSQTKETEKSLQKFNNVISNFVYSFSQAEKIPVMALHYDFWSYDGVFPGNFIILNPFYTGRSVTIIDEAFEKYGHRIEYVPFTVARRLLNCADENYKSMPDRKNRVTVPGVHNVSLYPFRTAMRSLIQKVLPESQQEPKDYPKKASPYHEYPHQEEFIKFLSNSQVGVFCGGYYNLPYQKLTELIASECLIVALEDDMQDIPIEIKNAMEKESTVYAVGDYTASPIKVVKNSREAILYIKEVLRAIDAKEYSAKDITKMTHDFRQEVFCKHVGTFSPEDVTKNYLVPAIYRALGWCG